MNHHKEKHQVGYFVQQLSLERRIDPGPAGHDDDDAAQIELFQLRMATNVGDLWREYGDREGLIFMQICKCFEWYKTIKAILLCYFDLMDGRQQLVVTEIGEAVNLGCG